MKNYQRHLIILTSFNLLLSSCSKFMVDTKNAMDTSTKLSYSDYRDKILPKSEMQTNSDVRPKLDHNQNVKSLPKVPELSTILAEPDLPKTSDDRLVSISLNEDVPLKDALIEIGRLGNMELELDPGIDSKIILSMQNRPLYEVIERICNLANLRYKVDNGILRIERDTPYLVSYSLDFLNLVRSNEGSSAFKTSITDGLDSSSSGSGGSSSSSDDSGAKNKITSSYDGNLWLSIETDIKRIIDASASNINGAQPASNINTNENMIRSIVETNSEDTTDGRNDRRPKTPKNYLTVNKQASVISVYASDKQQKLVRKYIQQVKSAVSAQVLIEAKVVEITLNDDYRTGINWAEVDKKVNGSGGLASTGNFTGATAASDVTSKLQFGILNKLRSGDAAASTVLNGGSLGGPNLQTLVELMQQFGTTRTLSSPRVHAMNNQQAVLSFVQNQVYFNLTVTSSQNSSNSNSNSNSSSNNNNSNNNNSNPQVLVNSTTKTVPIGVILTLQPSINAETNEITMNIRPTISRLAPNSATDPAIAYIASQTGIQVSSQVPIVQIKELDSIVKIKSGQVMVIGGMMEEESINNDTGVPYAMSMPVIGNLFKGVRKANKVVQTIIFVKATIVPSDTSGVSKYDRGLYNDFGRDHENRI
jgi:MSHA biogenesis protein MshL